jgi:hypothetical protein
MSIYLHYYKHLVTILNHKNYILPTNLQCSITVRQDLAYLSF